MTLAGLPRAGAVSKAHDYNQNVQKKKGLLKKWVFLTAKQFEAFRQKLQELHSSYGEQKKRSTRPQGQKLSMNHVARKKLTEAKLKKKIQNKSFRTLQD